MAPPGQRLVPHAQATGTGALGSKAEILEEEFALAQGVGGDVAAHQYQVGAQFLHQVELALQAVEVARQAVAAATLEIAERLEQGDRQPQVGAEPAHVTRAATVIEEIVLEDFHAVEAGGGDGFEFVRQGSAQGNGGDRTLHFFDSCRMY